MLNKSKKIIDVNRETWKKIKKFLGIDQATVIRIGILATCYFLIPEIGSAADIKDVPGGTALNKIMGWVTGPVPKTVGALAIGVSGGMLAFGEMGPAAKKTLQVACGTGCAIEAPTLIKMIGDGASGLGF